MCVCLVERTIAVVVIVCSCSGLLSSCRQSILQGRSAACCNMQGCWWWDVQAVGHLERLVMMPWHVSSGFHFRTKFALGFVPRGRGAGCAALAGLSVCALSRHHSPVVKVGQR